ncbi:MAG: hypothetical protein U0559_12055 [Anaerolineae bacterium]
MKTRFTLLILVLLSLVLAACQQAGSPVPADPVEAVKLIADKQKDIKTQHLDLTLDLGLKIAGVKTEDASSQQALALFKNFKGNLTASGDIDTSKNDLGLKGAVDLGPLTAFLAQGADKLEFEIIKIGDKMYTKAAGQDWSETDVTASTTVSDTSKPQFSAQQITDLLKKTAKAEKLADEKIDNVDSFHYKVTLNTIDLLTELQKLAQSTGEAQAVDPKQMEEAQKVLKDSTVEVELWVGKADLYIRQQNIHFTLNVKDIPDQPDATVNVDLTVNTKTTKINEPITLSAPK